MQSYQSLQGSSKPGDTPIEEPLCRCHSVQASIYSGKRISIFACDRIQCAVVYTAAKRVVTFLTSTKFDAQGLQTGSMTP